jgi:hypothetical protein
MGLWIFGKLLGRGIQRAYHENEARKRFAEQDRQYYAQIERENYHAGRGYARGQAFVQNEERLRRQDERDRIAYNKRLNKMWEVPQVNENAFFPNPPNRKKKKRSPFDF